MVENHTRDLLQMKAKETQLARSRNDAELTQAALSKAQRDLEALRQASQTDTAKEIETYKFRAEKAEQRILEREELDQSVLSRLTDLEEFIRGMEDHSGDAQSVSRMSAQCKDLEDQNRRLLSQMEEYASRITTLEEVYSAVLRRLMNRVLKDERDHHSVTETLTLQGHPCHSDRKMKKRIQFQRIRSMLHYQLERPTRQGWHPLIKLPARFILGGVRLRSLLL
jgi:chromosome segregation ATPase